MVVVVVVPLEGELLRSSNVQTSCAMYVLKTQNTHFLHDQSAINNNN